MAEELANARPGSAYLTAATDSALGGALTNLVLLGICLPLRGQEHVLHVLLWISCLRLASHAYIVEHSFASRSRRLRRAKSGGVNDRSPGVAGSAIEVVDLFAEPSSHHACDEEKRSKQYVPFACLVALIQPCPHNH